MDPAHILVTNSNLILHPFEKECKIKDHKSNDVLLGKLMLAYKQVYIFIF